MNDVELRVLVVEDELLTAEAHAAYVGRCPGFTLAGVARTGSEAIRALNESRRGEPIDLVLLDMNLPDMTGIELCRSMRAAGLETGVIAITARRETAVVRASLALGIVQYLIKPFTFAAFAAKLEAYREYSRSLEGGPYGDQHQVDIALASLGKQRHVRSLPKGMTGATLLQLRATLAREEGWASATEMAELTNTSRVTARRYLEYLAEAGLADRRLRRGRQGRPEVEYHAVISP